MILSHNSNLFSHAHFTQSYVRKALAANGMSSFPYVLVIAQPLCTSTSFFILFLLERLWVLLWKRVARNRNREYGSPNAPSMDCSGSSRTDWNVIPHLAVVGCLLSLNNLLAFTGNAGNAVPGPVVLLLDQIVIPSTVLLSLLLLCARYTALQFIGATVVGVLF